MARADTALKQTMSLLLMILMPLNNPFFRARLHIDTVGRIFQMLAAIAETLAFTKQLLRVQATTQDLKYSFVNMTFDAYQRDMISIGWCPFTVQLMAAGVCRTAYASTVRPFIRGDLGKKGHSACDKGGCIVNNINRATYVVQHTSPTCGCDPKGPPLEDVVDALQRGCVPTVVVECGGDDNPQQVDVLCRKGTDTTYVAISHVWVDGLGSTTEEGLPVCQLRRLSSLTRSLVPGGAFWMDALCVPERKDMRKEAIELMARTYRDAEVVLVIDSGIRSCSLSCSREEQMLCVLTSGWMQRPWTLQEAVLAKRLVFQFADGIIPIQELTLINPE